MRYRCRRSTSNFVLLSCSATTNSEDVGKAALLSVTVFKSYQRVISIHHTKQTIKQKKHYSWCGAHRPAYLGPAGQQLRLHLLAILTGPFPSFT